ncbi:MAG: hypothetical protein KME07_15210 [Pegethrix bostrychoides GSE-TBD4-15B]|jgi:O-antigen ligase|uniref:Tic20 family protein Ycf60 n=1 Tax=Pegethrix bostrychoides GSE-TBD4-15B TaxID=2839662 RepID=A0A951U5M4_9CYAN|nr:hypothetical protein [Pegethrix bostrychoides GSE-TBD4-15B]
MTWRGSTTPQERIFACLPYLLPFLDGLDYANPFLSQFPVLQPLFLPFLLLKPLTGFPFGLIIFFALFLLVIRNENISHFIRFNAMQAILIDIVLILCGLIFSYILQPVLQGGLILETLFNVVFLGTVVAVIYSVVQSALGRYAEIPTLSEAVYMQVR